MPDHFYVYPAYVGAGSRQGRGRRVTLEEAVPGEFTAEELAEAARALGWKAEVEAKPYPREAWKGEGRIKVTKKEGTSKSVFLHTLARKLKERVEARKASE